MPTSLRSKDLNPLSNKTDLVFPYTILADTFFHQYSRSHSRSYLDCSQNLTKCEVSYPALYSAALPY